MPTRESATLFERARRVIPGGVNSPVRAFAAVGGVPRFFERGEGSRVWDADGNEYVDWVGSWGPLILGHANEEVLAAASTAMRSGTSFGAPTAGEVELAELLCSALPSLESVRLVSSGTEASMSAIRLARAATGRSHLLKFEGCYHGHTDALLVGAGSGAATLGVPDSPGVPDEFARLTLQVPYNDLDAARAVFATRGAELAAVLVEPVAGNMGCVLPEPGFLEGLRALCDEHGALLVFDEVITGFRVAWGGAQTRLGVLPDLTCLGKVIGGGFPAAAYGGRRDLMSQMAPSGPVYQAGTLSGNPVAVAAGLATLRRLERRGSYEQLEQTAETLADGLMEAARDAGVEFHTTRIGGMLGYFFHPGPVRNFAEAGKANHDRFRRFFAAMLEAGIYLAPSPYESLFVSLAHGDREVEATLAAARAALQGL